MTILSGVVIVIFAFVGAEIVTIAAAESGEPEQNVTKAVNQVVLRVLTFYVGAIFLIVCIVPWSDVKPGTSPFITALENIGIPGAADVMNAIVVTAVLSCLNSGMYTGSRMLFALARRGDAPKGLLDVNRRGVPVKAILLTSSIGFASTIVSYLSPDKVFLFLVNSSGAIALFVYLLIAVSELRMRRQLEREAPERLKVRMWAYPYLTYLSIVAMVVVIASMALVDDVRSELIPSLISLAVVLAAYWFRSRAERRTSTRARRARRNGARRHRHRRRVSGIGRAVALALLRDGYAVVLAGRRREPLEETGRAAHGARARARRPDRRHRPGVGRGAVRATEALRPARPAVQQRRRRRAAGAARGPRPSSSGGAVVDVNLTGAFLCTQEAFRLMKAQDAARRADHQQRLDLGARAAARLGRLHRDQARDHRPDQVDLARRPRRTTSPAARSTSATPRPR